MVYDVPDYTWVELARAISNQNVSFEDGGTCSLLKGNNVEVIGTDLKLGTLVRYHLPEGEYAAGARCPDGALIFFPQAVLVTWPAKGEVQRQMTQERVERANVVGRLLYGE